MTLQFTRPMLLANLIAWPVAWVLLARWLEGYAVRVELGLLPFMAAGAAALALAMGTVAVYAVRIATAPPVLALRGD